jgi:hypothetical protein
MNNETFLSNDGKKFGGDALSYHMLFSDGWLFLLRRKPLRRSPDATSPRQVLDRMRTEANAGFSAEPNC